MDTLPALHGFLAIRSSSTAAARIVETVDNATRRVLAAPDRPASHDWIVLGLICASILEPSTG